MTTLTRTSTATLTSSENSLQRLVDKLRCEQRLPTQVEVSYAENLCQAIEKQAWRECVSDRGRMLSLATHARQVFNTPFTRHGSDRDDDPGRSGMYLDRDNEAEGKELVLRTGEKRSACTSSASNSSKRQQRQPDPPAPECSARSDQRRGAQGDFDPPLVIARNNGVLNSTNDEGGHSQSLENPSATNYLTNSAPIYSQNVNSGSGQQNIKVIGNFDPPPQPTAAAVPDEYEVPNEPQHHEQRGSGLQKLAISNDVKNQTSGDNRPGGHNQTLKGPHGRTHMRTMAPIYNQNVNSGSGQQNIDVTGKMGSQKHDCQETSGQGAAAAQSSQLPVRTQTVDPRPQRRNDLGLDRRASGPAYPSGQNSPSRRRSRSPARPDPHSRSGSVVSRPYSPRRYGSRRDDDYRDRYGPRSDDDYEDRYGRARSTSNGDSYGSDYSSDYSY